jgi:hypothetical protein
LIEHIRALLGPLLLLSNAQSSATRLVADRLDALANELSSGAQVVEVGAPPNENGLPGSTGKDPRAPRTVDGFVLADLAVLESAFVRRSGG